MQVKRAYKLRAYPTRPQESRAVRLLRALHDLYNAALQERREAWRMQRVSVSYSDQSAQLREIAADPDGQGRHRSPPSSRPSAASMRPSVPSLRVSGPVRRLATPDSSPISGSTKSNLSPETAPGGAGRGCPLGARNLPGGRSPEGEAAQAGRGRVKTLQLKREYRRWYVIVVVETEAEPLPPTGRAVGVDVGVVRFLTTSDGAMVANPGSSTRPRRHSPTCSGVRSAPSPAPGTASDCGGY